MKALLKFKTTEQVFFCRESYNLVKAKLRDHWHFFEVSDKTKKKIIFAKDMVFACEPYDPEDLVAKKSAPTKKKK